MEKNNKQLNKKVIKLSDIEAKPISRNKTFFNNLDIVYGTSDLPVYNIGMPKGKISLWAGESGVGKSRLCIEVAKRFSINYYENGIVLYIQTESTLEDFASWAKDTTQYHNIRCSGVETIKEIVELIYYVRPKLVFIDSINEIIDFSGNAKSASRLIKGEEDLPGLKQATSEVGCHTILLGQLNSDKTIKGGTSLPHLVDIALNVVWQDKSAGIFRIEVGAKHRYGNRENIALFKHTKDGVIEYVAPNKFVDFGVRRVSAMTKSGTVAVGSDGFADFNDPEFQEHLANLRASRPEEFKVPKESLYDKIGNLIGDFLGK